MADDAQGTPRPGGRTTYVLVDGENIDGTLGNAILKRRPEPDDRPRWERVIEFATRTWDQPVKGLFFLAASHRPLPMPFIQALTATGFTPIPLSGEEGQKVVDLGIQRTLDALQDRDGDVMLVSHDGDFLEQMRHLLARDGRRLGLVAFREFVNAEFGAMFDDGLQMFDLEHDVRAFNSALPRLRVIPLSEFNPLDFL